MNTELQENNYIIVEGFLHPQMSTYIGTEFKKHCVATVAKGDIYVPGSPAVYGYPLISQLLVSRLFFMNDLIGERLYPTYCYARWYKRGAELKKHIDSEPCEISVTLNLGGDPWPIYFTKPDGSISNALLNPGDAVIYNGIKSEHWRETFEGTDCVQAFLHYVTVNGPNYFHAFDSQRTAKGQI